MAKTDWDATGPTLQGNIAAVAKLAQRAAEDGAPLNSALMAQWHAQMMDGLAIPDQKWAGCFRGSGAARNIGVRIGDRFGTAAAQVAGELEVFDRRLEQGFSRLDDLARSPMASEDVLLELLTFCAWVHGEWVRIHPFVNGNGRTARLWVNVIALRCRVPAFLHLRPRPGRDYEVAAARAMDGDWQAAIPVLHRLLAIELARN